VRTHGLEKGKNQVRTIIEHLRNMRDTLGGAECATLRIDDNGRCAACPNWGVYPAICGVFEIAFAKHLNESLQLLRTG